MEPNVKFVEDCIEKYRRKLLDTSKRNNLISFKHSESSRQFVRVIDELPDILYKHFTDGKTLTFEALPEEDHFPLDESSEEFKTLLEQGKLTDEEYLNSIDAIGEDDENSIDESKRIERILRDKIRAQLGLQPLVNQKRLSNIEVAKKNGINPSYEMPFSSQYGDGNDNKHTDKYIQTLLKPEEMVRALSGLTSYIKTDTDETGVNTLYAAFGFLHWFEAESSNKPCTSPLFLIQLEIKKELSKKGYVFKVTSTGEKPEINLSLIERLKQDFGMVLPDLKDEDTPEKYIDRVSELLKFTTGIPKKDAWRVKRYITIGRFRFSQLVMFNDLNSEKWPANNNVSSNAVIQKLFSGESASNSDIYSEDYDVDTETVENAVPLLITLADASQHSAIVDVMNGKNLAIKGPPGTGKSQTITNIIANALAKGKKVLFLAEKMAALNVVHERLNKAGLGPFCLELHSTKAQKTKILKSIEERITHTAPKLNSDLAAKIGEFKKHRDHISEYINILNSRFGVQGRTVYDYLWATQLAKEKLENVPSVIKQLRLSFAQANLSETQLSTHLEEIELFIQLRKEILSDCFDDNHPWGYINKLNISPFEQEDFIERINFCASEVHLILKNIEEYSLKLDIQFPFTIEGLQEIIKETEHACTAIGEDIDASILDEIKSVSDISELIRFYNAVKQYNDIVSEIKVLRNPVIDNINLTRLEGFLEQTGNYNLKSSTVAQIQEIVSEKCELKSFLQSTLQNISGSISVFNLTLDDSIDKISEFTDVPAIVSSVPREYLLYRNQNIIDETSGPILKNATETKKAISEELLKIDDSFDISLLGEPREIRAQAAILENSGFFSFLDSSFRKAKKTFMMAQKNGASFAKQNAARTLKSIANLKDNLDRFKNDTQLKNICGVSFNGIDTDFEKLVLINDWAANVRHRFSGTKELTRNIRNCLLTGEITELDALREFHHSADFREFKSQVSELKSKTTANTTFVGYISSLENEIATLTLICDGLLEFITTDKIALDMLEEDYKKSLKAENIKQEILSISCVSSILKDKYNAEKTDLTLLENEIGIVIEFSNSDSLLNLFPKFFNFKFSTKWNEFKLWRDTTNSQIASIKTQVQKVEQYGQLYFSYGSFTWEQVSLHDLATAFDNSVNNPTSLGRWVKYSSHLEKLKLDVKNELIENYLNNRIDLDSLPTAFNWIVFNALSREIYSVYPSIKDFNGQNLSQARVRLKELDSEIMNLQQISLNRNLASAKPLPGINSGSRKTWTEGALINNEVSKQKQHVATRDLLARAGKSIQLIKPCFMMSPMTVAQYLPPGQFEFDLIVIDEASQMCPEDALGGIARSKQIVVVGDPEQLPPTNFFKQNSREDDEEFEDFNSDAIMDLALSSFRPHKILSRHYRSQHESLIEFSNYHFYERNLILFPSPVKNPDELGVRLEFVGGTYSSSSNLMEVKAITKAALDFMRRYPDRSLGIATMNQVQSALIEVEMDKAIAENPHAAKYKARWKDTLEEFFVKNLESVQGDERDAIFISTVYGPDKGGVVHQKFGPINNPSGYRRLNVLFTRAKKNMWVFTSLKPEDIKTSKASSKGLLALKGFLTYAVNGVLDGGVQITEEADSDFELWVKQKLESIGCEVHTQVGVAGYKIDLGIKHPKYPHGYLLGIECDGAAYHSSKSARERDIIRQQILENLGWKIYRIWSTDWFSQPVQEFERLRLYIEHLIKDIAYSKESELIEATAGL